MLYPSKSFPIRTISRTAAKKRAQRFSWLIAGAGLGISYVAWSILVPASATAIPTTIATTDTLKSTNSEVISFAAPVETKLPIIVTEAATLPTPSPAIAIASLPVKAAARKPKLVEKPSVSTYPLALNVKTEDGDTLTDMLVDIGVNKEEAQLAVASIRKQYDPRKLAAGQTLSVILNPSPTDPNVPVISSLKLPISTTVLLEVTRSKNVAQGFDVKKTNVIVERKLAHAGGRIESSLYETGIESGMPLNILSEVISAYSYDVDFQRDVKRGDRMDVLFEHLQTKYGVAAGHGNVLFAELTLHGRTLKFFRYVDKFGIADYYNEKGESIRKALLRTPINGARITSGFGMRNHPLLGYSKMHRGIDFGAPTGTPIYAAGDGIVQFTGRKGGYGNYLRLHHNNKYDSAYAHLSRFAAGIAPGKKVKQGQIIAYVGATGMATGPHLHYEILANNQQINPAGIKFKTGNVLGGKELAAFHKNMGQIQAQLANTPRKTDMAMASVARDRLEN